MSREHVLGITYMAINSTLRDALVNRLRGKIKVHKDTKCWEWMGATSGNGRGGGYGKINVKGQYVYVHRLMYSLVHGFVSNKKQIDHTCENRLCCNPAHLQEVSNLKNQRLKTKRKT